MAPGAYGQTCASLGGSFSHNAPINVYSLATVAVQFVQAIINCGYIVLLWKQGNSEREGTVWSCKQMGKKKKKR